MPVIKVIRPFGLRLGSAQERRDFGVGEHFVSDEEFAHWFVQACLKEGRAALPPEELPEEVAEEPAALEGSEGTGEQPAAPTREELMALTVAQLKEMAGLCGIAVATNATKAVIVDAILAGAQEGE